MLNSITVDLEPWMCYYLNKPLSRRDDGGNLEMTTRYLLDILEDNGATATFFTLGVVFEWFPELVEEIESRGHEIAFHSYSHGKLDSAKLKSEIARSKSLIDHYRIVGFRSPRMEMSAEKIQTLSSEGFLYDSSVYCSCHVKRLGKILEVPVSTYPVHDKAIIPRTLQRAITSFEIPVGSGLSMGLFNSRLIDCFIRRLNEEGFPFISFIHPWQLTRMPEAKLLDGLRTLNFLYGLNLSGEKLGQILQKHTFVSIREALKEWDHLDAY